MLGQRTAEIEEDDQEIMINLIEEMAMLCNKNKVALSDPEYIPPFEIFIQYM